MFHRPVRFAMSLALVTAVILSGCASKDKGRATDSGVATIAPPAGVDANTCGIEGFVGDESLVAIPDADVGIVGSEKTTKTALDGRFSFSFLTPSTYQIVVSKLGFKEDTRRVPCEAGKKVDDLVFQLKELPKVGQPYLTTVTHTGLIGCAVGFLVQTQDLCKPGTGNPGINPQANNSFIVDPASGQTITAAQFELSWQPAAQFSAPYLSMTYPPAQDKTNKAHCSPSSLQGTQPASVWGKTPICVKLEAPEFGKSAYPLPVNGNYQPFRFDVSPGQNTQQITQPGWTDQSSKLVYDQKMEFWITFFYNGQPVPAGFTAIQS